MRAFVALDLPEALIAPLTGLQRGLAFGRAVDEENLHLTLAFLGDLPEHRLDDVIEALSLIRAPAPMVALAGLEVFGTALAARAEAAGLEGLQAKVMRAAREAGLTLERRRFRPHVTFARLPKRPDVIESRRLGEFLALNGAFKAGPAPALSFSLYRSHLREEGAIYELLASFPLAG